MALFLHENQTVKLVKGGETLRRHCPECREDAVFREVEVITRAGVFFVLDIFEDKERRFRCSSCGELFELTEQSDLLPDAEDPGQTAASAPRSPSSPSSRPIAPPRDLLAELEAERERTADARARRDREVDDELAALKRRLGK